MIKIIIQNENTNLMFIVYSHSMVCYAQYYLGHYLEGAKKAKNIILPVLAQERA